MIQNTPQQYTVVKFLTNNPEKQELIIALLSELGFEGFLQDEDFLTTYIEQEKFDNAKDMQEWKHVQELGIKSEVTVISSTNWNEEWEKSFEPVIIENRICIRADFHPKKPGIEYDIVINPKMSFGTGHHDTTSMMMKYMLGMKLEGSDVFDFGCGTGILSILASKMKASYILGIDNDPNACINAQENIVQNLVTNVDIKMCDITGVVGGQMFDYILANINRNTILHDLTILYNLLKPNGALLVSGVLLSDMTIVLNACKELDLTNNGSLQTEQWAALCFKKLLQ